MLRGIITIFTVFVLLLSAVKASEDYYLGKLGKPVEEVPFDGGKSTIPIPGGSFAFKKL